MTRRFDWADYRTTEYQDIDPERVVAILPTAAIEQHGPHLPVGTDTMIAEGMLAELRTQCPEDLDIRILLLGVWSPLGFKMLNRIVLDNSARHWQIENSFFYGLLK